MSVNIYSDQSRLVNWTVRRNTDATLTINVTDNSVAYNLSSTTFLLEIFNINSSTPLITLTQGSGLTNGGASGVLTVSLTNTQIDIEPNEYFWKLRTTAPTDYLWFNGIFKVNGYTWDGGTDYTVNVALTVANNEINLELIAASVEEGGGADSFSNGLTNTSGTVRLGGDLTQNTVISDNGGGWNLELGQNLVRLGNFRVYASNTVSLDGATSANFQTGSSVLALSTTAANLAASQISVLSSGDLIIGSSVSGGNKTLTLLGANLWSLASPSAIRFLRINADNSVSALSASDFLTAIGAASSFVKSDNSTSSVTGTVTVTKLGSIVIPANTFTSNDTIRIHAVFNKSGTASTFTARFYFNTSDSLSGATQIGVMAFANTILYGSMERHLLMKTATTQEIMNTSELLVLDTQATTALSSLSIDFTVDQYFLISLGLGNAADTGSLRGFTIERLRS